MPSRYSLWFIPTLARTTRLSNQNQTCNSTDDKVRDWTQGKNNRRFILSKTFPNPSEIITTNGLQTYLWVSVHRSRCKPAICSQLTLCRRHMESEIVDNYMVNLKMVHGRDVSSSNHKWPINCDREEKMIICYDSYTQVSRGE